MARIGSLKFHLEWALKHHEDVTIQDNFDNGYIVKINGRYINTYTKPTILKALKEVPVKVRYII